MAQDPARYFLEEQSDGISTVLVLDPEILPESNEQLYAIADRLADTPAPRRIVLNLANVQTIRSVAIGILVQFQKRVRDSGGTLKLCRINPELLRVFEITKMDQLFDIHESQQEAIDAFHGKSPSKAGRLGSWFSRLLGD